jgi:hypothetical protein
MTLKTANMKKRFLKLKTRKNKNGGGDIDPSYNIVTHLENTLYDNAADIANSSKDFLIRNINDLLESPKIAQLSEAGEDYLRDFNEKIENPVFKEEVQHTMNVAKDYIDIAEKPFEDAVAKLAKSGEKATSAALSGAIRVGTDAMAAIPGVGAVIELGKIANDGSTAISKVIEAGKEAAETADDFIHDVNEKNNLLHLKQTGGKIIRRTAETIDTFTKKTPKRLLRRNRRKTKRVRFTPFLIESAH